MFERILNVYRRLPEATFRQAVAWVFFGLVFVTATRLTPLQPEDAVEAVGGGGGGGSALRQAVYAAGFLVVLLACRPWDDPRGAVRMPIGLAALLGYCALSVSWSIAPDISVRRLILTVMVAWMVVRTVDVLGHARAMTVMLHACLLLLAANYAAVALTPLGVHHQMDQLGDTSLDGNWRGILPHKNATGPVCAYTVLLLAFAVGRFRLALRLALIAAAAIFLVTTQSKTSIALVVIGGGLGGLYTQYDTRDRLLLGQAIAIAAAIAVYAGWKYLPAYIRSLQSSIDAFTGRIQIWRVVVRYLRDDPYRGVWFGAFWNVAGGPVARYTDKTWIIEQVAEGHNGYLDLWAQLGIVGLVAGVVVLLLWPIGRLLFGPPVPRVAGGLQLAVLVFALGHNFTESSLLATDQFMFVTILMAVACIWNMDRRRTALPRLSPPRAIARDG